MTKTDLTFDPQGYAPVAERIRLFYRAHPTGRIISKLITRSDREVVFQALVYRDQNDAKPAATGWAAEREGDGEINEVACLENTETSAIGRALANLGFTASRQRPSAEELEKASRARVRLLRRDNRRVEKPNDEAESSEIATPVQDTAQNDAVLDALALLRSASRMEMRPGRAARFRETLSSPNVGEQTIGAISDVLRRWIHKRREELAEG
jgi:hypothetical protein